MNDHHDDHKPDVKLYLAIGAALFILTVVTVWISKFHLAKTQAIALGLAVASLKAGLVCAFFMHLKGEKGLIHKILLVTIFFGAILVIPRQADRADLGRRAEAHAPRDRRNARGSRAGREAPRAQVAMSLKTIHALFILTVLVFLGFLAAWGGGLNPNGIRYTPALACAVLGFALALPYLAWYRRKARSLR
jgi:cytochrome c oxidase subunit IV